MLMNKIKKLVRSLSSWAWEEMLLDVSLAEWKFGRRDDGKPKDWSEWNNIRAHLHDSGYLRNSDELNN